MDFACEVIRRRRAASSTKRKITIARGWPFAATEASAIRAAAKDSSYLGLPRRRSLAETAVASLGHPGRAFRSKDTSWRGRSEPLLPSLGPPIRRSSCEKISIGRGGLDRYGSFCDSGCGLAAPRMGGILGGYDRPLAAAIDRRRYDESRADAAWLVDSGYFSDSARSRASLRAAPSACSAR
jgi:hypothetical protein